MAHHSSEFSPEINNTLNALRRTFGLGPTGAFPEGKLVPEDEGELRVGITHLDGKVVIDFGKPTAWIGFTPEQADEIADMLRTHAAAVREERAQRALLALSEAERKR